jgi:hypothetical protein
MPGVVTVPELLDGHTVLDIECLDRLYLNGYVPTLQVAGQVVTFLHDHRGMPIASGKNPADLDFTDLDAPLIGAFLAHLETGRRNSATTRNARLTAIH